MPDPEPIPAPSTSIFDKAPTTVAASVLGFVAALEVSVDPSGAFAGRWGHTIDLGLALGALLWARRKTITVAEHTAALGVAEDHATERYDQGATDAVDLMRARRSAQRGAKKKPAPTMKAPVKANRRR